MRIRSTAAAVDHDSDFSAFLRAFPKYANTALLDDLRATEYGRLDRQGHVYLDYTGAGLHAESHPRKHAELIRDGVFGNPHSESLASKTSTEHVERARAAVLRFFSASPEEYFAIFTSNASGALKLAGESYPFGSGSPYLLTADNHNSVNGIREFARTKGARIDYAPLNPRDLRIDRARLGALLTDAIGRAKSGGLFAYPAQSNFSGVQHPLDLIEEAHAAGWDVLLDAAAFVATNRLDVGRWKPDAVAISFYKMFGYPTGVGCLLMRRTLFAKLRRPWFGGGTVRIASVGADGHHLAADATAYEDGTSNYLSAPAVEMGLDHLASIGIDTIHERVRSLTGWLLERLGRMRHTNGRPCVRIHGPGDMRERGGTVAFNILDVGGAPFDIGKVEALAVRTGISLRTGCFCNPGAGEAAFGLDPATIVDYFRDASPMDFDELRDRIRGRHGIEVGAVRVSLGLASNFQDLLRLLQFIRSFRDRTAAEVGRAPSRAKREVILS
jgi:selenocysteine lyase/cysteine desulfurase